jgi:transcriptional regulator with XRE-family HTH domain
VPIQPVHDDWESLGAAIRDRRLSMSLTLVELAEKVGLSQPFLSQVENGKARPSLSSLHGIADALDTTPQAFFGGPIGEFAEPAVVRSRDAQTVDIESDVTASAFHVLLSGDAPFHILEFNGLPREFLEYYEHDGFEAAYVISGTVEIDIGGVLTTLSTGDSISYRARLPHRLRSVSRRRVRVLLIETKVESLQDRSPGEHGVTVKPTRQKKRTIR